MRHVALIVNARGAFALASKKESKSLIVAGVVQGRLKNVHSTLANSSLAGLGVLADRVHQVNQVLNRNSFTFTHFILLKQTKIAGTVQQIA